MMEPFRSHPRSQTAIFLAGCILSCLLQLVPAQQNLTVVSVPEQPILGQSIILNVQTIQEGFTQCEWTTPVGNKIIFNRDSKAVNTSQDAVLHRNCSLSITNLRSSHQGKYTIKVTAPPAKQQEARGPDIYIGFITLTFCEQIRIKVEPPNPRVGQDVTLTPEGVPKNHDPCQWEQRSQAGNRIIEDYGEEPNKQKNQKQKFKQQGCSLHLSQLTMADSANYSVYVQVFLDQSSGKQGEANREQMKCYRSQTQLKVLSNVSGSSSVKYSAGIIAGALLGSLTWTGSLSLLPLLFGVLSPFFPEC